MSDDDDPLAFVARVVAEAGLECCLIGGHAVNVWVEPRFTADIDLTVLADPRGLERLQRLLVAAGYRVVREVGGELPSGPDFVRFARGPDDPPIDVQSAKTAYQVQVVSRARSVEGRVPVATPEDLVVLKLIAHRAKDLIDLHNLVALAGLDWGYVERWAHEWQVSDRLATLRGGAA